MFLSHPFVQIFFIQITFLIYPSFCASVFSVLVYYCPKSCHEGFPFEKKFNYIIVTVCWLVQMASEISPA